MEQNDSLKEIERMAERLWRPIETCPEKTPVLTYASWGDYPYVYVSEFRWKETTEWETISESSGASGCRRQIRQEKKTRDREWTGWGGDFWMPLPDPPPTIEE